MDEFKVGLEIADQYNALEKTCRQITENAEQIKAFFKGNGKSGWTFIGCGSGYTLCIAGAAVAKVHAKKQANAIAAGDLLLNFPEHAETIKDSLFIVPSRSGSTSEVLKCIELARHAYKTKVVSLCTKENATLAAIADLNISLPWAFDEATCQTRTITNLYVALMMIAAIVSEDKDLVEEINQAVAVGNSFINAYAKSISDFTARTSFSRVIVLADAELEGIAREGMLAFIEIARLPANYFHVLDVRHGPIVLADKETLVVMACSPHNVPLQANLVADLKQTGSKVVVVSDQPEETWHADMHVAIPVYKQMCVRGIPLIYVIQALAYNMAVKKGINPDNPPGLKPWIQLKL
ncbi:MAG: SIS domain-containing protein [Candidatus Lokiarchaeota archaeon]|nr:SIS domain-containing protein [Candidatus Lokiarchaeota archaeon]